MKKKLFNFVAPLWVLVRQKKKYFQTKAACYFAIEMYAPGKYNDPEVSPNS